MLKYNKWQLTVLLLLRLVIGWHFLHEGVTKALSKNWSSAGYLSEAKWLFNGLFNKLAENLSLLKIVDFLNVWGLIAIGASLIIGLFTRCSMLFGLILLLLYYVVTIPLPGIEYGFPVEGNYLIVNKILVEFFALLVLYVFPTSKIIGIDKFLLRK